VKGDAVKKILVGTLVALALLGAACGGDDGGESGGGEAGGSETATLTAAEFAFDPSTLTVASGGSIEFTNEDDAEHNITAEEAGIDEDVDAKGSVTVDLSDVEAGTYDFFCEYHPDMKGTLEVTG
jgi:plastocyanin